METLCDRVLDVTDALAPSRCPREVLEQIAASGTSPGANTFEAAEAMGRADFLKTLAIAQQELSETRFWLRLVARRQRIPAERLGPLQAEADELRLNIGSIVARTRKPST
ncbi:MAG: four helix bundle protein [Phycisphaerales bacterium]|nr:four helix bundle protein [Phycisphaerales bacterium]